MTPSPPKEEPPKEEVNDKDTPRTYRSDALGPNRDQRRRTEEVQTVSSANLKDCLERSFILLKRSCVLARRGRHWSLLQNAAQAMWNSAHSALLHLACDPDIVAIEALRQVLWEPFWQATDGLLDMLKEFKVILLSFLLLASFFISLV